MATEDNRLAQPIELCSNALIDLINQFVPDDDSNYLLKTFEFENSLVNIKSSKILSRNMTLTIKSMFQ